MKKVLLFSAVAIATFMMVGCKTAQVPNDYQAFLAYQQQMQKNEQTPQWETNQPKRQKREVDECITMATENSGRFRAYGEGKSFREGIAIENAEMDAVIRMVQQIQTAVEGARDRYRGSASKNLSTADEERIQSYIKQFVVGTTGYRIIKTNLYDLSDGTVQCYVCIEQKINTDDMAKKLSNELSDDGVLGIEFNRDRFAASIKEDLEKYKAEQRANLQ
ncbi:MAG: hypothetical protein ACI4TD_13995 [Phocaeicola sp.]